MMLYRTQLAITANTCKNRHFVLHLQIIRLGTLTPLDTGFINAIIVILHKLLAFLVYYRYKYVVPNITLLYQSFVFVF